MGHRIEQAQRQWSHLYHSKVTQPVQSCSQCSTCAPFPHADFAPRPTSTSEQGCNTTMHNKCRQVRGMAGGQSTLRELAKSESAGPTGLTMLLLAGRERNRGKLKLQTCIPGCRGEDRILSLLPDFPTEFKMQGIESHVMQFRCLSSQSVIAN